MSDVTELLNAAGRGDPLAARQLLPLVYDELRRLASRKMTREARGQTLTPTALVHEAYLRLVDDDPERPWTNRAYFFAAAAEAIRRILVENARRRRSAKRGGDRERVELEPEFLAVAPDDRLLALHEALERFSAIEPAKAEVVKLRYFSGLTIPEVAEALGISVATAERHWSYARAWLRVELAADDDPEPQRPG